MKKLFAILFAVMILLSVAACSKDAKTDGDKSATAAEEIKYTEPKKAFSDVTLVETSDDTNIYYLLKDGTYKESYKGNILSGTWKIKEDDSLSQLVLTISGTEVSYYYMIEKDADGYITGISQYEGRSFNIKEYSIPDTIVATPTKAEETTAEKTTAAETSAK